jgi:hypothetical protein
MIEGKASNDLDLARIRVALLPEFILGGIISPGQQSSPPATVSADGSFRYQGRRYNRVRVDGLPPAGYVKSLQVGANDLLNGDSRIVALGPMTIVVAVDGGTVNGVVVDNGKKAMANAVVALAPSSPELRRRPDLYRSTTTDFDGRFQLQGVPGGDYKLFVWEYAPEGAWQNAEFLQNYERFGQTIRVTPGGNQNVTVTVIPPQR